jgi:polyadenylate-binding protein
VELAAGLLLEQLLFSMALQVVYDGNGKSKGFGFIHFEKEQSAKEAIEKVDGMELDGKKIFVGEFVPHQRRYNMTAESYTNL